METQGPPTQANYLTPLYINILYVPLPHSFILFEGV